MIADWNLDRVKWYLEELTVCKDNEDCSDKCKMKPTCKEYPFWDEDRIVECIKFLLEQIDEKEEYIDSLHEEIEGLKDNINGLEEDIKLLKSDNLFKSDHLEEALRQIKIWEDEIKMIRKEWCSDEKCPNRKQ